MRGTFTDDAGNEESLTSAATAAVEAKANNPATGLPAITGTAQVGVKLTADLSGIVDLDGVTNATPRYQWQADGVDIPGETLNCYTPDDADEGKTISVVVSFTDDAGNEESLTSAATAAVEARPNRPAMGALTITGTARVGELLTADVSSIKDDDGLDRAAFAYQWQADGTDLSGATGSNYTLAASDEGKAISVTVSFTDYAGPRGVVHQHGHGCGGGSSRRRRGADGPAPRPDRRGVGWRGGPDLDRSGGGLPGVQLPHPAPPSRAGRGRAAGVRRSNANKDTATPTRMWRRGCCTCSR